MQTRPSTLGSQPIPRLNPTVSTIILVDLTICSVESCFEPYIEVKQEVGEDEGEEEEQVHAVIRQVALECITDAASHCEVGRFQVAYQDGQEDDGEHEGDPIVEVPPEDEEATGLARCRSLVLK